MKKMAIGFTVVFLLTGAGAFAYHKKIETEKEIAAKEREAGFTLWKKFEACKSRLKHTSYFVFNNCHEDLSSAFEAKNENAIALVAMLSIEDNLFQYMKKYKVTLPIEEAIAYAEKSAENGVRIQGCAGSLSAYYSKLTEARKFNKINNNEDFKDALYNGAKWAYITNSLTLEKYQKLTYPEIARYFLMNGEKRFNLGPQDLETARNGVESGRKWIQKHVPSAIKENSEGMVFIVPGEYDNYLEN